MSNYGTWCVGKIINIRKRLEMCSDGLLYSWKEKPTNQVEVIYDPSGTGHIQTVTVDRMDPKYIRSDDRFLKNRLKLTAGCQIEIFNETTQWTHSYIKSTKTDDDDDFLIKNILSNDDNNNYLEYNDGLQKYDVLNHY